MPIKINSIMPNKNSTVRETGDDPQYYAVVTDEAVPSTWLLPMFDGADVASSVDQLSYSASPYQTKLLPDQRKQAIARLRARIPDLNIEDSAKASLLRRLDYCDQMDSDGSLMELSYSTILKNETLVIEFDSSFGGGTKNIPTAPDVNIAELTKGDSDPVFVNLPVAKVDAVSRNGLLYDKALVGSIKEQIIKNKPDGIFGHIPEEERSTKFPLPDVHWIGAEMFEDELWAKGYVVPGEAANYVRRLKAANAGISTSIYGTGEFAAAESVGSKRRLRAFILEELDFAPPARASLQLGGKFVLTSEMVDDKKIIISDNGDQKMSKLVTELTKEDVELIPQVVREAIIKADGESRKTAELIAEYESEKVKSTRTIAEQAASILEYKKRDFNTTIAGLVSKAVDWNPTTPEAKDIVAATRNVLLETLTLKMGDDLDAKKAERVFSEMVEGSYKTILEAARDQVTGGHIVVGETKVGGKTDWRDEAAKNGAKTKEEWGI